MAKSKKKVQMPAGIRNKLMAAMSMLLVSSIMMVSTTYAWFTLSTAPEVTGITTSVGANGNLEIALLNTDTYADLNSITSAVGNSSAAQAVTRANITWGNLVDLNDVSYGLSNIKLLPADVNGGYTTTSEGGAAVQKLTSVTTANLLKTPVYGADGRVEKLDANTVSAVYNGSAFAAGGTQTYGVRAIGVSSNLSARQITFNSAKSAFNANAANASRAVVNAIKANAELFGSIALTPTTVTYNAETLNALKAVAQGAKTSLESIVKAYANAIVAKAAAKNSGIEDTVVAQLQNTLSGVTSAVTLKNCLSLAGGAATGYSESIEALVTAQSNIDTILGKINGYINNIESETPNPDTVKSEVLDPLVAPDTRTSNAPNYYLYGGIIGASIPAETGKFELITLTVPAATIYAGAENTTGNLSTVTGTVNSLPAPDDAAETNITDFYGYVIDFAFRTNASGANLQLQTSAKNRVYSDQTGADLATQGSGSTVTFTYTDGLSAAQASTLLSNIKLVFFDPDEGDVYATAGLTDIETDTTSATANVKVTGQNGDAGTITALGQNTATKVSVLVYLDGNNIQNKDVANATTSGSLNLNLQFSSSVALQPMQNTALKTMTKAPTP